MSAADRAFFDTNVLIYLFSDDRAKAGRAEALAGEGGWISVQVLNEFVAVARRKLGFGWEETAEALGVFRGVFRVVPLDLHLHDAALRIARETGYTIYDALILAAAARAEARTLWSEDMHAGQIVSGVEIVNPFAEF